MNAYGATRLFCAGLAVLACSAPAGAGAADAAEAPEKMFELALTRGTLPAAQRALRVDKGDAVRLRVTSDAPGELHLHGYRIALKLSENTAADVRFKAFASGRYALEWHAAGEPAGTRGHHGPPLATLDVRPK
jgi:FtsP/CotA-like multicopper oxidase with cupredoxin domain